MADYAIGDVQGCFDSLQALLDLIQFDDKTDSLWFVGDLVNRGPNSLEVLRFVKDLAKPARITLGNHDLHLLALLFTDQAKLNADDTLAPILQADDRDVLGHWLRKQSILYHDETLNVVMSHAGIAPSWDLTLAKTLALELESVLSGDDFVCFLTNMYGNKPNCWSPTLSGLSRLRVITNYFTRMRLCDPRGCLSLAHKGSMDNMPPESYPWFLVPGRKTIDAEIVFGHWAALQGQCPVAGIHALDTGCFWGGSLTALRLQDKQRFSVKSSIES